jgi:hypothetical protein
LLKETKARARGKYVINYAHDYGSAANHREKATKWLQGIPSGFPFSSFAPVKAEQRRKKLSKNAQSVEEETKKLHTALR